MFWILSVDSRDIPSLLDRDDVMSLWVTVPRETLLLCFTSLVGEGWSFDFSWEEGVGSFKIAGQALHFLLARWLTGLKLCRGLKYSFDCACQSIPLQSIHFRECLCQTLWYLACVVVYSRSIKVFNSAMKLKSLSKLRKTGAVYVSFSLFYFKHADHRPHTQTCFPG